MKFILIVILFGGYAGFYGPTATITAVEFNNEAACHLAELKVQEMNKGYRFEYLTACTPKGNDVK